MKVDKYIICDCGKKKRIHWEGKAEFQRGELPICVGASECKSCGIVQEHYLGTEQAIKDFVDIMDNMNGGSGGTVH